MSELWKTFAEVSDVLVQYYRARPAPVLIHWIFLGTLRWRQNGHDSVLNHQPHDCLLNRLFRRRSKKTSKLCVTGFCAGNSPGTGEFPAQMASYAENVSIWWRHHETHTFALLITDMVQDDGTIPHWRGEPFYSAYLISWLMVLYFPVSANERLKFMIVSKDFVLCFVIGW